MGKVYGKSKFSFSKLRSMPNVQVGKDRWLKVDLPTHRVWLSKKIIGYCYIEEFKDGVWKPLEEYQCDP